MTEIAHGTNTKAMRTTATYDIQTKEFILHTPDFEAAKCWSGNLGNNILYFLSNFPILCIVSIFHVALGC